MSANGINEQAELVTGGAYKWMSPDTSTATDSVTADSAIAETASKIVPFIPPNVEPFVQAKKTLLWNQNRKVLLYLSYSLPVIAANLCLLYFMPFVFAEMKWAIIVLSIVTASTALFLITTLLVINHRVKGQEVERRRNAVTLYLEQTGWTRLENRHLWPSWVKDFGLGRGFLRVEYYSNEVGITGECDEQTFLQLKENLYRIDPDLPYKGDKSSTFNHVKLIDFSNPPAEDTRIEELGYGQSGWIGEKAIYDRRGDPSYSTSITAKIHRGAFVRQARRETHNVLVITCKRNQERFAEARAKAFERAQREGAPAGTTIAIVYDWVYEFQIATIEKLTGEQHG